MTIEYCNTGIEWFDDPEHKSLAYRAQGPCTIFNRGNIRFSQLSAFIDNRRIGPAVIEADGYIAYNTAPSSVGYHRTDGPARIYPDGEKQYWINGKQIPKEEFFLRYGVM